MESTGVFELLILGIVERSNLFLRKAREDLGNARSWFSFTAPKSRSSLTVFGLFRLRMS